MAHTAGGGGLPDGIGGGEATGGSGFAYHVCVSEVHDKTTNMTTAYSIHWWWWWR